MMPEHPRNEWPDLRAHSSLRVVGTALLLALASSTVLGVIAVARGTFSGAMLPL